MERSRDYGAKLSKCADKISEINTEGIVDGFTHAHCGSIFNNGKGKEGCISTLNPCGFDKIRVPRTPTAMSKAKKILIVHLFPQGTKTNFALPTWTQRRCAWVAFVAYSAYINSYIFIIYNIYIISTIYTESSVDIVFKCYSMVPNVLI